MKKLRKYHTTFSMDTYQRKSNMKHIICKDFFFSKVIDSFFVIRKCSYQSQHMLISQGHFPFFSSVALAVVGTVPSSINCALPKLFYAYKKHTPPKCQRPQTFSMKSSLSFPMLLPVRNQPGNSISLSL